MYLFGDNDKIEKWRYNINTVEISIPNEGVITIPTERFINFQIFEYYETHMFPIFYIKLSLEDYYYYMILKNKEDVQFHLRIDKYPTTLNDNGTAKSTINYADTNTGIKTGWINDYFSLIRDDDKDDMGRAQKEQEWIKNYEERTTDTDPAKDDHALNKEDNVVEFYLFNKNLVDATKTNICEVFSNVTITDVLMYLFKLVGIKNLLMAPPDNKKVYKELFIPKMSIMSAFRFIDTYYGIYSSGSYIYFGLKKAYVLPFSGKCNAFQKNEIKYTGIIIPYNLTSEHSSSPGTLKKKESKVKSRYIVADYRSFEARNLAVSNDYLNSNDIELVDAYSGQKTVSKTNAKKNSTTTTTSTTSTSNKKKNTKKSTPKKKKTYSLGKRNQSLLTKQEKTERKTFVKQLENPTENSFYGTTYVARSDAMAVVISINCMDYDVAGIHLNKQFNIYFEDDEYYEKYKGSYAILSVTHGFTKMGEEDFQITTTLILARTTENYGDMYNIFGKIKIKKNGSIYKSAKKVLEKVSIKDYLKIDNSINVRNQNSLNNQYYKDWYDELYQATNEVVQKYKNNQITDFAYLDFYADKEYNLMNATAISNGIIETNETITSEVFSLASTAAENQWIRVYSVQIPALVADYNNGTKTKDQLKAYYIDNKKILDLIKKKFIFVIGETSYNTVMNPYLEIINGEED